MSAPGDAIYALPGTHNLGTTVLHFKNNTALLGYGEANTILQGSVRLSSAGMIDMLDNATLTIAQLTIHQTLTTDFAACITLTGTNQTLITDHLTLLCGTDGLSFQPTGGVNSLTATALTATGSWDWLYMDSSNGGSASVTVNGLTALCDGSTGFQSGVQTSTGVNLQDANTVDITDATLTAANGPTATITVAATSGPTVNLSNVTLAASGSAGSVLQINAVSAPTNVNLHLCTYDPAKTSATLGATINVV